MYVRWGDLSIEIDDKGMAPKIKTKQSQVCKETGPIFKEDEGYERCDEVKRV
jgi:hypothetical protein